MSRNLLQKFQTALQDKTNDHVVDYPFDGGEIVGEDGGSAVTRLKVGVGGCHGGNQQWIGIGIISQADEVG